MARPKSARSAIRNSESIAKWHYTSHMRFNSARDQMAIRACARRRPLEAHPALSAIPVCFNLTSFDHLVGKPQQCGRDRETQRPRRLEINDHFELSGLNDR